MQEFNSFISPQSRAKLGAKETKFSLEKLKFQIRSWMFGFRF